MSNDPDRPLRVLVVVDKPLVADVVALTLKHKPFVTRYARDGFEALEILEDWRPQLAIVDLDCVRTPVVRRIVTGCSLGWGELPVLALTQRGDLTTDLEAFELGVEDIMSLPLSPDELLARVLVITRRGLGADVAPNPVLTVGELEIDILNRRLRAGMSEIHLTGLQLSLLSLLAAKPGQVVAHTAIQNALWGADHVPDSNVVERHVRGLRAKLQDDYRHPRFIATVPGQGYCLIPTIEERLVTA